MLTEKFSIKRSATLLLHLTISCISQNRYQIFLTFLHVSRNTISCQQSDLKKDIAYA